MDWLALVSASLGQSGCPLRRPGHSDRLRSISLHALLYPRSNLKLFAFAGPLLPLDRS